MAQAARNRLGSFGEAANQSSITGENRNSILAGKANGFPSQKLFEASSVDHAGSRPGDQSAATIDFFRHYFFKNIFWQFSPRPNRNG